ncbi:uncharacterized protein LOC143869951 [Tasmannia lanceolata]|uniref:uncharacterized protein LOC143869951 n=1 Tax=Tasmannia lanceolata TaxID=3420 RepID=UPI0040628995
MEDVYGGFMVVPWWFIWKERNSRVFEGVAKSSFWIFIKIISAVISWARSLPLFHFVLAYDLWEGWQTICKEGISKVKIIQPWLPPPEGMIKLNFDGSSLGNPGDAGIGGLCRDSEGDVLWAFSGPIGVADSNEAEVRAVHCGIKSLDLSVLDKVIVEGDSSNIILWLLSAASPPWRFLSFFEELDDLVLLSSITFRHVRRSANSEADSLARSGVFRPSLERLIISLLDFVFSFSLSFCILL